MDNSPICTKRKVDTYVSSTRETINTETLRKPFETRNTAREFRANPPRDPRYPSESDTSARVAMSLLGTYAQAPRAAQNGNTLR